MAKKMNWNISFENFKKFGPDHPEKVDFEKQFPTGAYVAYLKLPLLDSIIDQNRVSLNKKEIMSDINNNKWTKLNNHISKQGELSPPWAIKNENGKLGIEQGLHRFQYAYIDEVEEIPVIVSAEDAMYLKEKFHVQIEKMLA